MRCQKCKKGKLYTINFYRVNEKETRRTRKCDRCGEHTTTIEKEKSND